MSLLAIKVVLSTTELITLFEAASQSWRPLLLPPNYTQVNFYPFTALSDTQQYHSKDQFTNSGADEAGLSVPWDKKGTSPLQEPCRAPAVV